MRFPYIACPQLTHCTSCTISQQPSCGQLCHMPKHLLWSFHTSKLAPWLSDSVCSSSFLCSLCPMCYQEMGIHIQTCLHFLRCMQLAFSGLCLCLFSCAFLSFAFGFHCSTLFLWFLLLHLGVSILQCLESSFFCLCTSFFSSILFFAFFFRLVKT